MLGDGLLHGLQLTGYVVDWFTTGARRIMRLAWCNTMPWCWTLGCRATTA